MLICPIINPSYLSGVNDRDIADWEFRRTAISYIQADHTCGLGHIDKLQQKYL